MMGAMADRVGRAGVAVGAILVLVGVLIPQFGVAQSRLAGTVLDGDTGRPVAGAIVSLQAQRPLSVTTDQEGRFILEGMPEGIYPMAIRHLAYQTVDQGIEIVGGGRVTYVTVRLNREIVALSPIEVTVDQRPTMGRLGEVYDRMELMQRLGQGSFFTRDALERWGTQRVSDMLGSLPGVSAYQGVISIRDGCGDPLYYLDGVRTRLAPGERLDNLVRVAEIEAVEVYRRPSETPGEFGGPASNCGVVVIWTRRGL